MIKNINEIKMCLWIRFLNLNDTILKLNLQQSTFIEETKIFDHAVNVKCFMFTDKRYPERKKRGVNEATIHQKWACS